MHQIYRKQNRWKEALEMKDLFIEMRDSIENVQKKSEVIKQQLEFDYQKQVVADSIYFASEKREKDLLIEQQHLRLGSERLFRNSVIVIFVLMLFTFWLYYKRYKLNKDREQGILKINALETEQKLLRAQMNPHFIFNSLNAIQSLILDNEVKMSRDYLVKFSLLMRSILEQTRKNSITLNDEIETLRFYLEMEQLRFNGKFKYTIHCEDFIPMHKIKLAPLLIQPFVENSVIHGIRHKSSGVISVSFRLDGNFLFCIVQDDGIGRHNSAKYANDPLNNKSSLAIELAISRLQSKLKREEEQGSVLIIDEKDAEGNSLGTRVELKIPIELN